MKSAINWIESNITSIDIFGLWFSSNNNEKSISLKHVLLGSLMIFFPSWQWEKIYFEFVTNLKLVNISFEYKHFWDMSMNCIKFNFKISFKGQVSSGCWWSWLSTTSFFLFFFLIIMHYHFFLDRYWKRLQDKITKINSQVFLISRKCKTEYDNRVHR